MTETDPACLRRLYERLRATVVCESSPDGQVQVIVDWHGALTHVHFAESVRGADPTWLAAELMAVVRQAQSMLSGRVRELMPAGDAESAEIVNEYERRFPAQRS